MEAEAMLEEISESQRERLAFIEFRAYFLGEVRRSDITERFGVETAAATRDLALYRSHSKDNIYLDQKLKIYLPTNNFKPIFKYTAERVFTGLSQGLGDTGDGNIRSLLTSDILKPLYWPNISILAPITRAIHRKQVVKIVYHSFSSGQKQREIIPFALINNGLRWHVRAFDRMRKEFRDFVLTRVSSSMVVDGSRVEEDELANNDIQWSRIVELELSPHPKEKRQEIIAMDYGIPEDGVLKVKIRAALAGYFLRKWSVDCSENHTLKDNEIRLWLRNPLALYGVENASLAPGYQSPNHRKVAVTARI